jgi:hypothetical protein
MRLSVRALLGFELNLRAENCEKRERHLSRNARIS